MVCSEAKLEVWDTVFRLCYGGDSLKDDFSRILTRTGSKLMGLYEEGFSDER